MIAYIKGNILHHSSGVVVLENSGIGYEIFCSQQAYSRLLSSNGGGVFTYLVVRDDGLSLYGFESLSEKAMFIKLISVSGIGPKIAMAILSGMSLNDLAYCIASSDVKSLSSIKGLGKKTAERLILELREAICAIESSEGKNQPAVTADQDNAVMALMSLGYNRNESVKAVSAAIECGTVGLEAVIAAALKKGV